MEDGITLFSGQTQAQSVSYYVNRDGTLRRILTGNVAATMANRPWGHIVGSAPTWMTQDTAYYSFDGVFFYRNPRDIRPDGQGADIANTKVSYRTHIQDIGWQGWRSNGQVSGTSGEARRLEAIEI